MFVTNDAWPFPCIPTHSQYLLLCMLRTTGAELCSEAAFIVIWVDGGDTQSDSAQPITSLVL